MSDTEKWDNYNKILGKPEQRKKIAVRVTKQLFQANGKNQN